MLVREGIAQGIIEKNWSHIWKRYLYCPGWAAPRARNRRRWDGLWLASYMLKKVIEVENKFRHDDFREEQIVWDHGLQTNSILPAEKQENGYLVSTPDGVQLYTIANWQEIRVALERKYKKPVMLKPVEPEYLGP